jgi:hypothetical protein
MAKQFYLPTKTHAQEKLAIIVRKAKAGQEIGLLNKEKKGKRKANQRPIEQKKIISKSKNNSCRELN